MLRRTFQMALTVIIIFILVIITIITAETCPESCRCSLTAANCTAPFKTALLQTALEALSPKIRALSIIYSSNVLPAYTFMKFSSLRRLEILGNTNFNVLHKDAFSGLYNLRKLLIHNTNIKTIPADTVMSLIKLKNVDFSRNNLVNLIDNSFHWSSKNITLMDLSDNGISQLPSGLFRHVPNLEILHLSRNDFERLDVDFSTSGKLKELYLENTRLTQITDSTFVGLTGLKVLVLKNNEQLTDISQKAFEPLGNLKVLNLDNCTRLTLTPEMFHGLKGLKTLSLNSGFTNTILPSGIFNGLNSLKNLDLSNTNLSVFSQDDIFPCSMTLQRLNLSLTDVTLIENYTFSDCQELRELNLSSASRGMRTFEPDAFSGLENLTMLDISYNGIETLRTPFIQVVKPLHSAKIHAINDNVTCDCDILSFVQWMVDNSIRMLTRCLRPSWVYSREIATLSAQNLRCVKPDGYKNTLVVGEEVVGKPVTIACIAYGYHDYPNVTYAVMQGNPLEDDKTDEFMKLRIDDNLNQYVTNLTFKIRSFKPENSGTIDCSASNEYGNTTWEMKIEYVRKRSPKAIIVPWAIVVIVLAVVVTVTVVVCWCIRRTKDTEGINDEEDEDEDDFSPSDEF